MRTNPILTVTTIVITIASLGGAYYLLPGDPVPRQVEMTKPAISSTSTPSMTNHSH